MFCVIYRAWVLHGKEQDYQKLWHDIAQYFVEHRGALGSSLHKTEEGYWLAYSRWPDKATRDASWPGEGVPSLQLPENIQQAIVEIKSCIDQKRILDDICMVSVDDML